MTAKGIGHVAPDFDPRGHFNTLRVRPEYRLTLRLGDVEELFPHKPDTKEGRMERLQVLGLFYFPLKHAKAKDRFDACWAWVKSRIFSAAKDEDADKLIQSALKNRLVSGAAIPAWNAAASALPTDAASFDDPKPENFAKIRLPGGYTFLSSDVGRNDNKDNTNAPAEFTVNHLFDYEAKFYEQNLPLGRLPLIAKVEKRPGPNDDWAPAKDAIVYFQILPSYALDKPAYDDAAAVVSQFARPTLRGTLGDVPDSGSGIGTQKMVDAKEKTSLNADDPQGRNCHKSFGGKRGEGALTDGTDVAGHLFDTTSRAGFNTAHADKARTMSHKDLPLAEKATPDAKKHLHAVKAKANEDGEAGVLFTPSRMGGDRYRLRAYVGPPTQTSDGSDPAAAAVTTGTFVVWRNLRFSHYYRQDVDAPDSRLVESAFGDPGETEAYQSALNKVGLKDPSDADVSVLAIDKASLADPAPARNPYESIPRQFAAAFCEVELDWGTREPEELSQADWEEARKQAVADIKEAAKTGGPDLNWDTLFCMDAGYSSLKVGECGVQLPMRSPAEYNTDDAAAGTPKPLTIASGTLNATQQRKIQNLLSNYGLNGFLRHLTKDGALPGLTVFQGGLGNSWQILGLDAGNSGIGLPYRGCFVWYGPFFYGPRDATFYNFTGNWCHEAGHILFREHAPGRAGAPVAGGNKAAQHDPITDSMCLMNYDKGTSQYCGKCLLMLRGWKL